MNINNNSIFNTHNNSKETNIIRYPIISDVTDTENWEKKLLQNNFSYV